MAKKKPNKRPHQRPAQRAGTATATASRTEAPERTTSARAERKEQARLERERRIKQARRQVRMRRAARWGIAGALVLGVGAFIWVQARQSSQLSEEAARAASRMGCGDVQTPADEGTQHLQPGDPAPQYGTTPAASGPHNATPLPAEPHVYDQPVPETALVHNLEHGYVLIYYRAEGERALDPAMVDELAGLAEDESEVIMAPYPSLTEGTNLALVSWTRLLECGADGEPEDARLVAQNFIDQFRNSSAAPEARVP
jgi:hypothetical protein